MYFLHRKHMEDSSCWKVMNWLSVQWESGFIKLQSCFNKKKSLAGATGNGTRLILLTWLSKKYLLILHRGGKRWDEGPRGKGQKLMSLFTVVLTSHFYTCLRICRVGQRVRRHHVGLSMCVYVSHTQTGSFHRCGAKQGNISIQPPHFLQEQQENKQDSKR